MKRGKGGDSQDALRAIWTEGYQRGLMDGMRGRRIPEVKITETDLRRVFEPGSCAHPTDCPCRQDAGMSKRMSKRPAPAEERRWQDDADPNPGREQTAYQAEVERGKP